MQGARNSWLAIVLLRGCIDDYARVRVRMFVRRDRGSRGPIGMYRYNVMT